MIIVIEGLILCVLLVLYCLIGIRNGAVGLVHLYEKDVQERAIELGLTTSQKIKKNGAYFKIIGLVMYFAYAIICVYVINGADNFLEGFWQMTAIFLIMGVFDRIVIDGIWVGYTKTWVIPGTEDLRPYIPIKVHIKKWIITLVVYPLASAFIAGIMTLLL